jgi:GNAT superfamily N-acetyltransferase
MVFWLLNLMLRCTIYQPLGNGRLLEGNQERGVWTVPYEQNTSSKIAYVRTLTQREELPLLRDHLLRLDSESRHDRFNGFLDDAFIDGYAARCADDGTVITGYFEDGMIRGAAELHAPQSPDSQSSDALPEIAFSVERDVRRRGVGTSLFRRVIEQARAKGYKGLRITAGADNHAMRALARKFGAHLSFRHGESTGTIDLTKQPQAELAKLAVTAPFDAARTVMNLSGAYWKLIFSSMHGVIRGAAELHPPEQFPDSVPNLEPDVRRRGVGTILFRRVIERVPLVAARKVKNLNGAYWKLLFSSMIGSFLAAIRRNDLCQASGDLASTIAG